MSPISLSKRARLTPASPIRKLAGLAQATKAKGIGVHHLNIGQPDVSTPQEFFEGIQKYSEKVVSYESSEGNRDLRNSWTAYLNKSSNLNLKPEQMLITTGASEALVFTFMICCDPGDEILIFDPTYANYIGFAAVSGVNLVSIQTKLDEGFSLPDSEEIHLRITPHTKAILLCSPNNPTGTVYSKDELRRLLDICNERNIFLVVDETYREFVFDQLEPLSILNLEPDNERIIVIDSLSKRFSLCGARIGCLITPNSEVITQALSQAQARLASPSIDQFAAAYMLNNLSEDYLPAVVKEYECRRNTLYEGLSSLTGVNLSKPQGAFYCIARLPVDCALDFARFLLTDFEYNQKTVFLAPANGFYTSYRGGLSKVRIAFVLNQQDLKESVEIIGHAIEAFNKV